MFLPLRLPCRQDDTLWIEKLSELLLTSLYEFKSHQDETSVHLVKRAIFAVQNFVAFRDIQGGIGESGLGEAISQLTIEGIPLREEPCLSKRTLTTCLDGPIPFHVISQNAGALVRRMQNEVIFELFELSPLNEAVYGTSGRLKRHFPEDAVAMP